MTSPHEPRDTTLAYRTPPRAPGASGDEIPDQPTFEYTPRDGVRRGLWRLGWWNVLLALGATFGLASGEGLFVLVWFASVWALVVYFVCARNVRRGGWVSALVGLGMALFQSLWVAVLLVASTVNLLQNGRQPDPARLGPILGLIIGVILLDLIVRFTVYTRRLIRRPPD